VPGHLLQALRRRRGLTLDAVARAIGVDRANVSRWERSVSSPSAERLARLLDLLDAYPEERHALTTSQRHLLPLPAGRPVPLELLEERWEGIAHRATLGDRRLLDLELLAWQAMIWPLAARSDAARQILGGALAFYAEWLTWDGRWREAGQAGTRALDLLQSTARRTDQIMIKVACAAQVRARIAAQSTALNAKVAAVEQLRACLPLDSASVWAVYQYRHLAEAASLAGQPEAAARFADRGYCLAERLEDLGLMGYCRDGRADLHLRAGQPHEALALLTPPEYASIPYGMILDRLRWVRALITVGDESAVDWLEEAYALIEAHGYAPFRAEADELAHTF
jgi:transcriptional regulator with XRE-family HTH domain